MAHPNTSRTLFVSVLAMLALTIDGGAVQRPGAGGVSGGRPSSSGGGSRPSAPSVSRPSAPSISRPSAPTVSRPAATSSYPSSGYQRGAAPAPQRSSPTPTPQRSSPAPQPQPRYEQPSTPRYEQPSTPRYEQPSAPRYEQPAPSSTQPRYDAPSGRAAETGRPSGSSSQPSGRIYDNGAEERAGSSGRIEPARIDRGTPTPYRPGTRSSDVDLSGTVRPPRTTFPSLSGSRSGTEGGLASGRLARAGLDASRPSASVPHPSVDGDSLRARYGASGPAGGRTPATGGRGAIDAQPTRSHGSEQPGLSTGRSGGRSSTPSHTTDSGSRGAMPGTRTQTPSSDGGRIDGAGRARESRKDANGARTDARVGGAARRAGEIERQNPELGHRLRAAGQVAHSGGTISTGIVIGSCVGIYGGCWDPNGPWDNCGWYWNSCWYGGWWWGWGCGWPYGSCWYGWPGYCSSWPWYGSSYWGWGYSPWVYQTVIYDTYDPPAVVEQEPAPAAAPEPAPAAAPAGAPAGVAPEVRADLAKSADEALVFGDTAFREGRFSDAVRHYARAVEFAPERGSLWLILSDALFATGDYHYAAYALRRALEIDATLLEPLVDKHGWYADPAEFDRHIAWSEAYLRDHVLDEDARLILAANYLFAKRFYSATDVLGSAFATGLLETPAGKLVLERASRALSYGAK